MELTNEEKKLGWTLQVGEIVRTSDAERELVKRIQEQLPAFKEMPPEKRFKVVKVRGAFAPRDPCDVEVVALDTGKTHYFDFCDLVRAEDSE